MAKSFNEIWARTEAKIKSLKDTLPKEIGKEAQRFFTASFNNQGFTDQGLEKWERPQRKIPGTSPYKYPKKGASRRRSRATLVQSGKLRADVARSMKSATWDKIVFEIESEYAAFHNAGTDKLPQRQFIGNSEQLNKKVLEILDRRLTKAFVN